MKGSKNTCEEKPRAKTTAKRSVRGADIRATEPYMSIRKSSGARLRWEKRGLRVVAGKVLRKTGSK